MKIISTNIGKSRVINWKGKNTTTGIYKNPVGQPIFLSYTGVVNDHVSDTKVHGGKDKACYLYSEIHYSYWRKLYPNLDWNWGMLGENLTISDMDESHLRIGDVYEIGEARVQISQPRIPCYKLCIRFNSQDMIKQFGEAEYPGAYVRIIEEGFVKKNDMLHLVSQNMNSLTIKEINGLLYSVDDKKKLVEIALKDENLAESFKREILKKRIT